MRDVKFRVWDNEKGCWFQPIYKAYAREIEELLMCPEGELTLRRFDRMEHESLYPGRFEKVCYTGFKDKNEIEVYEGDILSAVKSGTDIPTGKNHWEVYYDEELLCFYCRNQEGEEKPLWNFKSSSAQYMIIGNINQHAHLLTTT